MQLCSYPSGKLRPVSQYCSRLQASFATPSQLLHAHAAHVSVWTWQLVFYACAHGCSRPLITPVAEAVSLAEKAPLPRQLLPSYMHTYVSCSLSTGWLPKKVQWVTIKAWFLLWNCDIVQVGFSGVHIS